MKDSELTDIVIEGRPDFEDHNFGVTRAKRHPKYVYGTAFGSLLHKVAYIQMRWWSPDYGRLVRRKAPRLLISTICGQTFFVGAMKNGKPRSTMCELPKPDAVLCGRCHGEGPTFGKNSNAGVTKREAKARLGCVIAI